MILFSRMDHKDALSTFLPEHDSYLGYKNTCISEKDFECTCTLYRSSKGTQAYIGYRGLSRTTF